MDQQVGRTDHGTSASQILDTTAADPGGPGGLGPLPLLKLVKKRWLPHGATSFANHRAPLGQISGSATVPYDRSRTLSCLLTGEIFSVHFPGCV